MTDARRAIRPAAPYARKATMFYRIQKQQSPSTIAKVGPYFIGGHPCSGFASIATAVAYAKSLTRKA